MSSIFQLKTSTEELSSMNQGINRLVYDQLAPSRDVTLNNFPNGSIHFRWTVSGQKYWLPSRSYLRLRCLLARADGSQLTVDDDIAPSMGLCSQLFQSAEFRINGKTVSRVADFMPQIDTLETRLSKSDSYLKTIGQSTNLWDVDFRKRQAVVCSDSVYSQESTSSLSTRLQLGFDPLATLAVAADTGVLTFAPNGGAALPNPLPFVAGDEIEIVAGGAIGTVKYTVSAVLGATTIQLNNLQTIAIGGIAPAFTRIRQSSSNHARGVSEFELLWTPPLSVFKLKEALPIGDYELILNPATAASYQKYAIESTAADKTPNLATIGAPTPGSNYIFNVQDMYMYVQTLEGPRIQNLTYYLDLENTSCQTEQFGANQSSFGQRNFDCPPSTTALTVAYSDTRQGTDTRYSSTLFKVGNGEELKLNRFFVNYSGVSVPAPDASPEFDESKDYTTQRYLESQIYSGAVFDTGGTEDIQTFHDRGSYYYFNFPKEGSDRSTRVQVNNGFQAGTNTTNMRLLLFSHSKQVARISIEDNRVAQVDLEDA